MEIKFDYGRLAGKIRSTFGTQSNFAKLLKQSERTISLKLNSKVCFTDIEIVKWCNLLGIQLENVDEYFFVICVQQV